MHFRVAARTILHLGAELISSDDIALYELIKNAFDAGSRRVDINAVIRIPHDAHTELRARLEEEIEREKPVKGKKQQPDVIIVDVLQEQIISQIDNSAPDADIYQEQVQEATSLEELQYLLEEANYIEIIDTGEGMSLKDLNDIYLTIGTRSRLEQRENQRQHVAGKGGKTASSVKPILGEKGVGRLSAMRLGNRLFVKTSKKGESRWNVLEIDWSLFSHESEDLIEDIEITPKHGEVKEDANISGTTIYISSLTSGWTEGKLTTIANYEFSKLTDPFTPKSRYPIALRLNGELITIPRLDEIVFRYAHATVEAEFFIDKVVGPKLVGRVNYLLRRKQKTFSLEGAHLLSSAEVSSLRTLHSLGPFKVLLYWFNRRLLTASQGVAEVKRIKDLVDIWAGGLMVYRDGFRVYPYGDPNDDWLDLDRIALASPGYKVNRRQIIGKVEISSFWNPCLVDQTNREGLRESSEKRALVKMLQHILSTQFRTFLNKVDEEVQAREPLRFDEIEARVEIQERQVQGSLRLLRQRHPEEAALINQLGESLEVIQGLIKEAKELADSYDKGRTQLVHLASLGLMVEIIAHELNRATSNTIATLSSAGDGNVSHNVGSLFNTLETQLKTIQKRLRILDPLSTSGRQVKDTFDLVDWIREILNSHSGQFRRHSIRLRFNVEPETARESLRITAVKGMFVQILENLIGNSVYWLKQQRIIDRTFKPELTVVIHTRKREISITDNGPGIDPELRETVFQPFVTTKPPGEGKGLGLYISREIAEYNSAILYLSDIPTIHPDKLNTFVLALDVKDK